jgi:hypothetical protein
MTIQTTKNNYVSEVTNTQELCSLLMKTPHYAKMGAEGIFAIVETAKSLDIDPRLALGGGLYYVKGKVEMSTRMMNSLIRSKGHSISKDSSSDDKICILHGTRKDNGDIWSESFSIEEATRAGLTKNPVWQNFPRDMLFARAFSRLARQLFPDVIGNCYIEGEISGDENIKEMIPSCVALMPVKKVNEIQCNELINLLMQCNPSIFDGFFTWLGVQSMGEIPENRFEEVKNLLIKKIGVKNV